MGAAGSNRLSFRRLTGVVPPLVGLLGLFLPVGTISGEPTRLLVTFLGIISASILPTTSLVVGAISSDGRSVFGLKSLFDELRQAVAYLLVILALAGLSVISLLLHALPINGSVYISVSSMTLNLTEIFRQVAQATALYVCAVTAIYALGIYRILTRVLKIKYDIARHSAVERVGKQLPTNQVLKTNFKNPDGFGKRRDLSVGGGSQ